MKNRFLKWASVLSALALVSGVLMVTANAHIGSSHSQLSTDGPDLVSVTATGDDTADFCFDEEVTTITDTSADAAEWSLYGYDSADREDATNLEESGSDENCVEADFAPETDGDIREMTVATVVAGEVEDRSGEDNPDGAASLEGFAGVGETAAPQMTAFDANGDDITFTFDQLLDCSELTTAGETDAENFGYYESDGDIRVGDSIVDCNDEDIEVSFDDTPAEDNAEDDAERVFLIGSVAGTSTGYNADALQPPDNAEGGETLAPSGDVCSWETSESGTDFQCGGYQALGSSIEDKPNLTDVDRTDDDQWTYSFDDDIDDDDITDTYFHIYTEDGTEIDAGSTACSEQDGDSVECTMTDPTDATIDDAADFEFPFGANEHCAVEDDNDDTIVGEDCAPYGSANAATSGIQEGSTDAPDLEAVEFNTTDEQALFIFDENVSDVSGEVDGDDFFLIESDGDTQSASDTDVDDVEDNTVLIDFDEEDLLASVGAGVLVGAAEDFLENSSVEATVGTEVTDTPTPRTTTATATGTATATQTATQTATVTRTTTTATGTTSPTGGGSERVATTLTIRYDRDANQFKGSAASRRRNCQRGRLVTLKKHTPGPNRSVGTDTTNRAGNWTIRKRVRRGRFYAVVAKKVYTNRQGTRIVCLRDKSVTIKV